MVISAESRSSSVDHEEGAFQVAASMYTHHFESRNLTHYHSRYCYAIQHAVVGADPCAAAADARLSGI